MRIICLITMESSWIMVWVWVWNTVWTYLTPKLSWSYVKLTWGYCGFFVWTYPTFISELFDIKLTWGHCGFLMWTYIYVIRLYQCENNLQLNLWGLKQYGIMSSVNIHVLWSHVYLYPKELYIAIVTIPSFKLRLFQCEHTFR